MGNLMMFYDTTRHNLNNTKSFFSQKNERCFAQLIEWLIVWLKENGQDQMQRGFNLHFSENVKFYCWTSDVSSTHNQGKTVSRIISMKISLKNCNNCRQFRRAVTGVGLTQLVICRPRQNLSSLANPDRVKIEICPPWQIQSANPDWVKIRRMRTVMEMKLRLLSAVLSLLTLFAYGDISKHIPQTYCNQYKGGFQKLLSGFCP